MSPARKSAALVKSSISITRFRLVASTFVLGISIACSSARAAVDGGAYDFSIYQPYQSTRALGMGNAFTAVADDYSTILYNPAGMARITDPNINLGLGAQWDPQVLKFKSDLDSASGSNNTQDMVNLIESNYGQNYNARVTALTGHWVRPKWGIAFIPVDINIDMSIHRSIGPALNVIATQLSTIAYGYAWEPNWGKDRWSLGVTAKAMYVGYFNRSVPAVELALNNSVLKAEDAKEGFTVDADVGMLWTPKLSERSWLRYTRPTIGVAVRNVGDYGYLSNFHLINKDSGTAPKLGRRLDVGTKFDLPDWWVWSPRVMADIRDIGHDNWTFKKGSHLGAEFLWKVRSWWQGGWRVGLSQGYFTAGFSATFGMFTLDAATYAEEIGPSDQPTANRRYVVRASLDW